MWVLLWAVGCPNAQVKVSGETPQLAKGREVRRKWGDIGGRHCGGVPLILVRKGARKSAPLRPPPGSHRAGIMRTGWKEVGSKGPQKDDTKVKRRSSLKSFGSVPSG